MRKRGKCLFWSAILAAALLAGSGCARNAAPGTAEDTLAAASCPSEAALPTEVIPTGISLGGAEYPTDTEELTLTNSDFDELYRQLAGFSDLKTVTLEGKLPASDQLLALKQAYPDITFVWNFDFCGVAVNTLTESIDLSGIPIEDTQAIEALMPCFYRLETVDMCGCGISDEEMDALNRRWPDTRFVWEVAIGTSTIRTDTTYFMPYQLHFPYYSFNDYSNLRYCTDMTVMDFGHYKVSDLSFVEYMPNLQYLLLGDTAVQDLTPLGTCTQLRYLELFKNPVGDFWPLTNLTKLEDLNLGHTPCHCHPSMADPWSYQPLLQMTWLDRLWLPGTGLSLEEQLSLQEALPNTMITFLSPGSTGQGWRYCRNGYIQRDLMGMEYLHE